MLAENKEKTSLQMYHEIWVIFPDNYLISFNLVFTIINENEYV